MVAGGSGSRFGLAKQYESIGGRRIVDISVATALRCTAGVVLVVPATDVGREQSRAADARVVVAGGRTRTASVRAGLAAVPRSGLLVCVHDAARPFASDDVFRRVVDAVRAGVDGAVPGVPVTDTIKRVDADRAVVETPPRASLVAVQTPQCFRADVLRRAHSGGADGTDDASLVEAIGGRVVVVEGDARNRKITHPEDLDWARGLAVGAG